MVPAAVPAEGGQALPRGLRERQRRPRRGVTRPSRREVACGGSSRFQEAVRREGEGGLVTPLRGRVRAGTLC